MLGYLPVNSMRRNQTLERKRAEYRDAIAQHYDIDDDIRTAQEQETLRQVLVDVPRTAPEVGLFRNDRIRRCLSRLLYIWAMRHPASSYVQGINDIATPLIAVFLSSYFDGKDVLDGEVMDEVSDEAMNEVSTGYRFCNEELLLFPCDRRRYRFLFVLYAHCESLMLPAVLHRSRQTVIGA